MDHESAVIILTINNIYNLFTECGPYANKIIVSFFRHCVVTVD